MPDETLDPQDWDAFRAGYATGDYKLNLARVVSGALQTCQFGLPLRVVSLG